jgi:Winged helix DNA-binding domain
MKQKNPSFSVRDAASFRLARQHLTGAGPADVVSICGDICGAQAQLTTAAYLQIWTRNHAVERNEIESALWQKRLLVKTHLMRQTLHLIPSAEFAIYISALRSCRVADALLVMKRCGIGAEEGHSLTPLILDALSQGPLGRAAVTAAVRPKVSKRVQAWMEKVWSITRIPVAEGLVCYGPGEGNEVTLILSKGWLKSQKPLAEEAARMELLRKYLRAYGPATLTDFGHWAGLPAPQVRPLREALGEELCEVDLDGRPCLLLRDDLRFLRECSTIDTPVRLLPHFDPYLLAHREKDHLLASRHYKRVYRNQGWISPVLLVDGAVGAVWSYRKTSKTLQVVIEPFGKLARPVRAAIAQEAEGLAGFFNSNLEIVFAS